MSNIKISQSLFKLRYFYITIFMYINVSCTARLYEKTILTVYLVLFPPNYL